MRKDIFATIATALALCSCGSGNEFKVDGNIEGADNKTVVLETSVNGRWLIIDSVRTSDNGDFKMAHQAPRSPEIYRISYDGKSVYFPIDSLEHITIESKGKAFGVDYTVNGSEKAEKIMEIDRKARAIAEGGSADIEAFKRGLSEQILADPSSIVAYYIINKHIGDDPVFDPQNSRDLKIIGAVANAYNTYKPNDPRTEYLVAMVLEGQKLHRIASPSLRADTMYVDEAQIIDIKLQDAKGKERDLRTVASKGDVVILNFTVYGADQSPAFNKMLSDIYTRNSGKGVEIYQIGYDTDIAMWKSAAANLPWIAVYDGAGGKSKNLASYNVGSLPMTFIINRKGELSERVEDPTKLESKLQKYL